MSVRKAVSLVVSLSVLALAACSDVTGPQAEGFCGVGGGPGTCVTTSQN